MIYDSMLSFSFCFTNGISFSHAFFFSASTSFLLRYPEFSKIFFISFIRIDLYEHNRVFGHKTVRIDITCSCDFLSFAPSWSWTFSYNTFSILIISVIIAHNYEVDAEKKNAWLKEMPLVKQNEKESIESYIIRLS